MDIRLIGEWKGTPYNFEKFQEGVLSKVFGDFLNADALVVFKNHHKPEENYPKEKLEEDFADFISAEKAENENKLFVVNYGWHDNDGETAETTKYLDSFNVCNSKIARTVSDKIFKDETLLLNKDGIAMFTFYKDKVHGYSVLWCLSDAGHVAEGDGTVRFWKEYMLKAAIAAGDSGVFLEKYSKMEQEGKKERFKGVKFVSIESKAKEIVGKNVDSIIEEMLDKVNYKEVVGILNATYKYRSKDSSKFVTKEQVRKWLKPWAEKKWPYYVMFGRNFELKQNVAVSLDPRRDSVLIEGSILDIKKKFPKYAIILSQFSVTEIFENKISRIKDSLNEWAKMEVGQKVTKYISNLCNDNELDTALSYFIQSKKLDSIAHISIDPMEFLTSSVTKHNWHSCHSVIDGQYGSGSCDYMFDEGSLVAFLANDKIYDYHFDKASFQWTSKSWRQIIYGSAKENNFIFCREYPQDYSNADISSIIRSLLESSVSKFCEIPDVWVKKQNGAKGTGVYENVGKTHYDDVPSRQTVYIRHVLNKAPNSRIKVGTTFTNPVSGKEVTSSNIFN